MMCDGVSAVSGGLFDISFLALSDLSNILCDDRNSDPGKT